MADGAASEAFLEKRTLVFPSEPFFLLSLGSRSSFFFSRFEKPFSSQRACFCDDAPELGDPGAVTRRRRRLCLHLALGRARAAVCLRAPQREGRPRRGRRETGERVLRAHVRRHARAAFPRGWGRRRDLWYDFMAQEGKGNGESELGKREKRRRRKTKRKHAIERKAETKKSKRERPPLRVLTLSPPLSSPRRTTTNKTGDNMNISRQHARIRFNFGQGICV